MIKVFKTEKKGKFEIIAVANAQKDLNNLRLMSYRINDGADKVQLNKAQFGGPYLKIKCDEFTDEQGQTDELAIDRRVQELEEQYN